MKDLGKRLLSLAIVLLMVLSMIPTQPIHVHAAEITAEAGNLATAISNANAGDEVKLSGDETLSAATTFTKSITIDLQGHTLTLSTGANFKISTAGVNVTIKNGNMVANTGNIPFHINAATASFTLDGIILTSDGNGYGGQFVRGVDKTTSEFIVIGSTLTVRNYSYNSGASLFHTVTVHAKDSTLDLEANKRGFDQAAIYSDNSVLDFNAVSQIHFIRAAGYFLNGSTVKASANDLFHSTVTSGFTKYYVDATSKIEGTGSKISTNYLAADGAIVSATNADTKRLTAKAEGYLDGAFVDVYDDISAAQTAATAGKIDACVIVGGDYTESGIPEIACALLIKAGTFATKPDVEDGYTATPNTEGHWVVSKDVFVAYVGKTGYYFLQEAIDAAAAGEDKIVVVNSNTPESVVLPIGVTLKNAGNYTIADISAEDLYKKIVKNGDGTIIAQEKNNVAEIKNSSGAVIAVWEELNQENFHSLRDGDTLLLNQNASVVQAKSNIEIKYSVTIDLQKNTLTIAGDETDGKYATLRFEGSSTTIKNGNIVHDQQGPFWGIATYGEMLIQSVNFTQSEGAIGTVIALGSNGKVTMEDCRMTLSSITYGIASAANNVFPKAVLKDTHIDVDASESGARVQALRLLDVDIYGGSIQMKGGSYAFAYVMGTIDNCAISVDGASQAIVWEDGQHYKDTDGNIIPATLTITNGENGSFTTTNCGYSLNSADCYTITGDALSIRGETYTKIEGHTWGDDTTCDICEVDKCAVLGHTNLVETPEVEATCQKAGCKAYWQCSDCGAYFADAEGTQVIENIGTWKANGGDGYIFKVSHKYENYTPNDNATCLQDGTETSKCNWCDETKSRYIEGTQLEHDYSGENGVCVNGCNNVQCANDGHNLTATEATESTCYAEGNSAYWTCSKCGKYFSDAEGVTEIKEGEWVLAKKAHTPADAVIENEVKATCTAEGSYDKVVYCSVCNAELSRESFKIDMIPHTEVEIPAVEPALNSVGYTAGEKCSVCGTVTLAPVEVPALIGEASINDFHYANLEDAIAAAVAGDVVVLEKDATIESALVISKSITLDGNNKTITYLGKDRAIEIPNNADAKVNVTIENLTVDCTASYCQRGINYNDDGALTLDNVTVKGTNVTYAVNLPGKSVNAVVEITNSDLTGNIALNIWGANATVNVTNTDLTSADQNSAENYAAVSLNNDGTTAAEGTVITITGGKITALDENGEPSKAIRNATATGTINVSATTVVVGVTSEVVAIVGYNGYSDHYSFNTLQDAINKATNDPNAYVKLLKDIELTEAITVTGTVILDLNGKTISGTSSESTSYALITNKGDLTITGDGKITYQYTGASSNWAFTWGNYTIANYGKLTVENGTIENTTNMAGHMYDAIDNYPGATAVINGGTISCPNYIAIRLFASSTTKENVVTVNGGKIVGKFALWPQNASDNSAIPNKATLTLNGGTVETVNGGVALYISDFSDAFQITKADAVVMAAPEGYEWINGKLTEVNYVAQVGDVKYENLADALAELQTNGGTLELLADATINASIVVTKDTTINGNGHKVTVTNAYGIDVKAGVNLVINGLTLESNSYGINLRGASDNANVTINDSYIKGYGALNVWGTNAIVNVNNSTLHGHNHLTGDTNGFSVIILNANYRLGEVANGAKVNVNGGKIIATRDDGCEMMMVGRIDSETGEINISEETTIENNGGAEQLIQYSVASHGDAISSSLQNAIDNAAPGETVILLRDVTITEPIKITKNITINGNGKTITYLGKDRAIEIPNNADAKVNVTIENLTVDCTASYCQRGINYNDDGALTLDNVTVKGTNVTYAVNLPGKSVNAVVEITNSDLTGNIALNIWGANATVNVTNTDLTSADQNSAENYVAVSLNNDGTTAAEGAVVTITGGKITALDENGEPSKAIRNATATGTINVSAETEIVGVTSEVVAIVGYNGYSDHYSFDTLQGAINKATNDPNAYVKLLKDIELTEAITVTGTVILDLNGKTISGTSSESTAYALITNKGDLTITGDGKITYQYTGASSNWAFTWGNYTIANYGMLTVENGTIENTTNMNGHMYDAIDNYPGATAVIKGGTISCPNYIAIRLFASSTTKENVVTVNGGKIVGKFALWPQNASDNSAIPNKATLTLNGGTVETVNGGVALYISDFSDAFQITKADAVVMAAPEGYEWINGKLTEVNYVAEVNGVKYESVLAALQAAIDNGAAQVVLLADSREQMPDDIELNLKADLEIVSGTGNPVAAKFYNVGTSYDFTIDSVQYTKTFTIGENVTFQLEDRVIWAGYNDSPVEVVVNGTLAGGQYWSRVETYVNATGTLKSTNEAMVMRYDAQLFVDGGKVEANYISINGGNIFAENGAEIVCGKININNSGADAQVSNVNITVWDSILTCSGNLVSSSDGTYDVCVDFYNSDVTFSNHDGYAPSTFDENTWVQVNGENGNVVFKDVVNNGLIDVYDGAKLVVEDITNNNVIEVDSVSEFNAVTNNSVAKLGNSYYATLQEAIDAANAGDTITVIADHELTATVVVDKSVTIDLGGKTITNVCGTHAFRIAADVTVKNGTVDSSAGGYTFIVGYNTPVAGNLTVESGNYYGSTTVVSITYGSATINGGYFEATAYNGAYDFTLNCVDRFYAAGQAKITVNGGEFKGFDPANNAAEGAGTNFVAAGYAALPTLNDTFVVGEKPSATVNDLGAITVPAGDYMVYGSGDNTMDMPLSFVMQFLADQNEEDMANSPFAEWYGDFVITFTGIENGSFTADGCYLAGHYGSFGWVKVPVDGMVIEEGARYPVMLGVGMGQKYDYICSSVQDFKCAMFLDPAILAANPNLKVTLELGIVDNSNGEDAAASALVNNESVYSVTDYEYEAEDFLPNVAMVGDVGYKTLQDAINAAGVGGTVKVLADVEESITAFENVTLVTEVAGGITITNTYDADYVDFNNVTLGTGVTLNVPYVYSSGSDNVIEGTLNVGTTYYHSSNATTIIRNGGKVTTGGMTVIRYNTDADAGIYVYGDGDDRTVEFSCVNTIGAYSGTFYAEDAVIEANMLWLDYKKNSNEESDSYAQINAKFVNSKLSVAKELRFYKDATMTLEGTAVTAGTVQIRENATPAITTENSTVTADAILNLSGATVNAARDENGIVTFFTVVASVNGVNYGSLQDAINAAGVGNTVELLKDVTTDAAIIVDKAVVLNLNGFSVSTTQNDTVGDGVFHVVAGGDLTINGEGTINGVGGNDYNIAVWADGGKVTINGGTYTNVGATDSTGDTHFDLIYVKNGGEVVINGGTFIAENPAWTLNSHDTKTGTIKVYGGEFKGFDPANNAAEGAGTNFLANAEDHTALVGEYYSICEGEHNAVVTAPDCVNDGYTTYTCPVCGDEYVGDYVDAPGHTEAEAVEENRVEATATTDGSYDMVVYCSVCGAELSRETFVIPATGVVVAVIGNAEYISVQAALDAATAGQTVQLVAPAEESYIMVPAGVTLDLNGQTLTVGSAASFGTIMGEGKLVVGEYSLAMSSNGNYLPYYETDGYVFKAVEMKTYGKNWAATPGFVDGAYTVWFYNNAASDNYFCDVMANADNELNVIVRATWTSGGITSTQDFVMSADVEAGYAANKGKGPYMYFDILGLEGLDPVVSVVYQVKVGNNMVEVASVPAVTNPAGAKVESVENAENVAEVNGVGYTSVSEALANATSGATVTVIAPSTEKNIMVPAGVTLNLNGNTLTVGSAASFGTIMGEGKLIVGKNGLALNGNGSYLPYYETDGYVFKAVEMKTYGKNWAATPGFVDGVYTVWFYNNAASDNYFCDVMANADNELNVIVRATWTSGGITSTQDFVMSADVEAGYAANKGKGPYMYFDILGLEGLDPVVSVVYQVKVGNFIVEATN